MEPRNLQTKNRHTVRKSAYIYFFLKTFYGPRLSRVKKFPTKYQTNDSALALKRVLKISLIMASFAVTGEIFEVVSSNRKIFDRESPLIPRFRGFSEFDF